MRLDGLAGFVFRETPSPYPQKIASPSVRGKPLIDRNIFSGGRSIQRDYGESVALGRFLTRATTTGTSKTIASESTPKQAQKHGNWVPGRRH